jgi:hypothetical protein
MPRMRRARRPEQHRRAQAARAVPGRPVTAGRFPAAIAEGVDIAMSVLAPLPSGCAASPGARRGAAASHPGLGLVITGPVLRALQVLGAATCCLPATARARPWPRGAQRLPQL